MTLTIDAKFEEKLTSCFKTDKNFLSEHSKVSKICTLIGSFHEKYVMFDLKEYRGVIFHGTRE